MCRNASVTNHDLAQLMDTSDEWIQQRSGIVERRYVSEGETPADLGEKAARQALNAANLEASEIDLIILATLSPQHEFPGTSFFVQRQLGLEDTPALDLRAQCSGFLYALSMGEALVVSGRYRRVLVLGCEAHSPGLEYNDRGRGVTVLFGDGAGAIVLEASDDTSDNAAGILEVRLHAQGEHAERLWTEAPGCALRPRVSHEIIDRGAIYPQMEGRFVFKHAVRRMPEVLMQTLHAASQKLEDVDYFLFHQANLRINEFVAQQLSIPAEKCPSNIQRYGNCSAASIPMLLAELDQANKLEPGQLVAMTGFGAGFTWGSALLRWG